MSGPGARSPITLEGLRRAEEELRRLVTRDRQDVRRRIQEARELGDLKENAEYHAAKERQAMVEGRIAALQHTVATSQAVDVSKSGGDRILFGATVRLVNTGTGEATSCTIVGDGETDASRGRVSFRGPLGRALLGRGEGDVVTVKAPRGDVEYEIESFEFVP